MERGGQSYYYHANHQGSVLRITDSAGAIVNDYEYDAYGNALVAIESVDNPYRYTGREWDAETGLLYYRARTYDPMTGRFLQQDPIMFASGDLNLYRYVGNNPVRLTDPLGLDVSICTRPVDINWIPDWFSPNLPPHTWVKTDKYESGMGGECPTPGQ